MCENTQDYGNSLHCGPAPHLFGGWAEYIRRRDEQAARLSGSEPQAQPEPKQKPKRRASGSEPRTKTGPPRPSELEQLESEIAAREDALAGLERKLADDWANVETLQAHRAARDELQMMLARWEELFERQAQ